MAPTLDPKVSHITIVTEGEDEIVDAETQEAQTEKGAAAVAPGEESAEEDKEEKQTETDGEDDVERAKDE